MVVCVCGVCLFLLFTTFSGSCRMCRVFIFHLRLFLAVGFWLVMGGATAPGCWGSTHNQSVIFVAVFAVSCVYSCVSNTVTVDGKLYPSMPA